NKLNSMKKILPAVFTVFLCIGVKAQCTPDGSETAAGMHPTQAEGLATGFEGSPYSQTLTVIIPSDTTVIIFGVPTTVPIDDATVTSVGGLPSGFGYACNVSGCVFPGGQTNCAIITGNPTTGQAGSYPLNIYVTYHAGSLSSSDTVTGYVININTVGIWEIERNTAIKISAQPNPFTWNARLDFITPDAGNVAVTLYNVLGDVVRTETIHAYKGENTYTLCGADLAPGTYLIELNDGKNKSTQRVIKQ
ncbi:MAG TPA: T9SS type A sorting domain-containing protein, partial [Flavobacteriales bacterium]|nr:T9SS type A sorting domain-containing protein [Flavobacteriales bacterium]